MRIRIWKLGSLEYKIMPSVQAIRTLSQILMGNQDQEVLDIVWDPAITVQEIEITPGGVDVVTADGEVTPELREKIQKVIDEHMGGLMEEQFFEWDGWDIVDEASYMFNDVTLKVDLGALRTGQKFESAFVDYAKGVMEFYEGETIVATFKLSLNAVQVQ